LWTSLVALCKRSMGYIGVIHNSCQANNFFLHTKGVGIKGGSMENQYEQLKQEFESLNDRFLQQKQNLMSLVAAVNWAISKYPSDRASKYLDTIIENLFSK